MVPQMVEESFFKFLNIRNQIGGPNLGCELEQHIYKRKGNGVCIINLKRTWEKLWCQHHHQEHWPLQVLEELQEVMTFGGERSQDWLPAPHWGVLHQSAYHHCVTQILLLCGRCYPMQQESSLSGSDVVVDGPRSSAHAWHYLPWVPWEIMPDLYLCRDAEEVKKEEQAELRKAMTKGRMSGWMNHISSSARILIWCCTGASCHWGLIWNLHCSGH